MNRIILVGNGDSVKKKKLGNKIDEFETVLRFNDYKINGFEEYVGNKCNIWVTCLGEEVIIDRFKKNSNRMVYFTSFNQSYDEKRFVTIRNEIPYMEKLPTWAWDEAKKISEYDTPSSGAVAAVFFSKMYDETYIYGFNFFNTKIHHYWTDKDKAGTIHKANHEIKLFKYLLDTNRIKLLDGDY